MSGDNDPEHMPLKDLLSNLATASLMNQPVPQTFAQKQGPLLGPLLGASILGASVYFGLLFAGRGKSLPFPLSIWGAKEKPPVTVTFGFWVITACVSTGIASCVSAVALCPLGQEP
jgi:hypothetical protein